MTLQRVFLSLVIAGLLQSSVALAQQGMGVPGAERPNPRFDASAPEIGDQIPDLTIVDDQGNPVNIRELASQSQYTVLTLGCLT
jgi:hypothetical protein